MWGALSLTDRLSSVSSPIAQAFPDSTLQNTTSITFSCMKNAILNVQVRRARVYMYLISQATANNSLSRLYAIFHAIFVSHSPFISNPPPPLPPVRPISRDSGFGPVQPDRPRSEIHARRAVLHDIPPRATWHWPRTRRVWCLDR